MAAAAPEQQPVAGAEELRALFDKALLNQNYAERHHQLAQCGRLVKPLLERARAAAAAAAGEVGSSTLGLEQLLGPLPTDTFSSLSALIVALNAGCTQTPVNLLTHASQRVRYTACKMLQASDAERVFLSNESNKQLKGWILKSCPTLPCTVDTMMHASQMGQAETWDVLRRTEDSAFLQEWLSACWVKPGLPYLRSVCDRHPDVMMKLLNKELRNADLMPHWNWVLALARHRPSQLLRKALVAHVFGGNLKDRIVEWGWRHQHATMVAICQEDTLERSEVLEYLEAQQLIETSHSRPTTNRKIETIVTVFTGLPTRSVDVKTLHKFVELLPSNIEDHRSKELENLVNGYWKMVVRLGRGMLLNVQEAGVFATMAKKLPVPLAVEQFFRILKDVEPRIDDYLFVLSDICRTKDGKYDHLMQKIFERYLQRDRDAYRLTIDGVEMFQRLVKDAKSMDVIQACFDILTQRLGATVGRGHLGDTVAKMKDLEHLLRQQEQTRASDDANEAQPNIPPHTKPLPTEWLRLIVNTANVPPHAVFLHGTLALWASNGDALKAAVSRFGTQVFWDTFSYVLHVFANASAPGSGPAPYVPVVVNTSPPKDIDLHLADVMLVPQQSDAADITGGAESSEPQAKGVYFARLEQKKQRTFGRDADERLAGYRSLIKDATKDCNVRAALDDLLPFLVQRLGGEQENIMADVMEQIIGDGIPIQHLAARLEVLHSLRKVWSKARGQLGSSPWPRLGRNLIKFSLRRWKGDQEAPDEVCAFGAEIAGSDVNYPVLYEELRSRAPGPIPIHATRWLLESAAPLEPIGQAPTDRGGFVEQRDQKQVPLQLFCEALKRMAAAHGKSERWAWEQWPFVEQRWTALLGAGAKNHPSVQFLLVDVVGYWTGRQDDVRKPREKKNKLVRSEQMNTKLSKRNKRRQRTTRQTKPDSEWVLWWRPLQCEAYGAAVQRCLSEIETGAIPGLEGARLIASRCREINKMTFLDSPKFSESKFKREQDRDWTHCRGKWWTADPHRPKRMLEDAAVASELRVLSKLLDAAAPRRQIQWCVMRAATCANGEASDALLKKVIDSLNPRNEGMARCVASRFPYLLTELADTSGRESDNLSSDLLSPCLDLWLEAPETRDARVAELVATFQGAEQLLFFGHTFAEHLAFRRQELFHQCMLKLAPPPADGSNAEFYHYVYRVPSLARVALMGRGWRNAGPTWYDVRGFHVHDPSHMQAVCSLTHMWAPPTQAEFLAKGLTSTDMSTLALIPRLEYVDGISVAGSLLEAYPRQQEGHFDFFQGAEQSSGHFKDVWAEVERLFRRTGPAIPKNYFQEREADQVLLNLGNADNADGALSLLGKYASKFKRAKEAFIQAVPNLSPKHARRIIKEVGLGPEAGVSLQVAALKLVMDLHVPNSLELYLAAWRDGQCHRDIAVSILVKVATMPSTDFKPEDVRDMFNVLTQGPSYTGAVAEAVEPAGATLPKAMSAANASNHSYMATNFLRDVAHAKWSLPFLPEVVASIALMPGCTLDAVKALRVSNNGFATSEVVTAFTSVLRNARLAEVMHASDTTGKGSKRRRVSQGEEGKDRFLKYADMLRDLQDCAPGNAKDVVRDVRKLSGLHTAACDTKAIRGFVGEVINAYAAQDRSSRWSAERLDDAYKIWVNVLRPGEPWGEHLTEMERELVMLQCGAEEYSTLIGAVVEHAQDLGMSREKHGQQAVADVRAFLELVLSKFPMPASDDGTESKVPERCSGDERKVVKLRENILATWFPRVAAQGCGMEPLDAVLQLCHKRVHANTVDEVVQTVKGRLWWEHLPMTKNKFADEDVAAAERVAWRALDWLADQDAVAHLPVLVDLWPQVLQSDTDCAAIDRLLARLGTLPASVHSIGLVRKVVNEETAVPQTHFAHATRVLEWLSSTFPRDALQLWPKVLNIKKLSNDQVTGVVATILKLCEARGLQVPELPQPARVPAVLNLLASSSLPRARLMAVSMLQELDLTGSAKTHESLLETLCQDSCVVVRAAALLARATVIGDVQTENMVAEASSAAAAPAARGDPGAAASEQESDDSEDDEGKGGKGEGGKTGGSGKEGKAKAGSKEDDEGKGGNGEGGKTGGSGKEGKAKAGSKDSKSGGKV